MCAAIALERQTQAQEDYEENHRGRHLWIYRAYPNPYRHRHLAFESYNVI